jgi:hypothetical protein
MRAEIRPIRGDSRAKLVAAIARGRRWLSEVEAGTATIEDVAAQEGCSMRHVNMTISLAFLAPSLVKYAVDGRLSHGIGVARLFDARAFLGWLRGERDHCKMVAIPTIEDEDAKRPNRERESLIKEQTRIVNRMKAALSRLGVRGFKTVEHVHVHSGGQAVRQVRLGREGPNDHTPRRRHATETARAQ